MLISILNSVRFDLVILVNWKQKQAWSSQFSDSKPWWPRLPNVSLNPDNIFSAPARKDPVKSQQEICIDMHCRWVLGPFMTAQPGNMCRLPLLCPYDDPIQVHHSGRNFLNNFQAHLHESSASNFDFATGLSTMLLVFDFFYCYLVFSLNAFLLRVGSRISIPIQHLK